MNLDKTTIFIVVIVFIFIFTSILVVEFLIANFFGVKVSELPFGVKAFIHLIGIGIIAYIVKKVFAH